MTKTSFFTLVLSFLKKKKLLVNSLQNHLSEHSYLSRPQHFLLVLMILCNRDCGIALRQILREIALRRIPCKFTLRHTIRNIALRRMLWFFFGAALVAFSPS
mmetsp:Transcript_39718/g.93033  ORF Transcript_39718/g.93033 Transcript_39718/m.93033 type:complete len:102 (+) Transcript_39718:62-367(+)